jgi:hypothetical protein
MRGWITVSAEGFEADEGLDVWIDQGIATAEAAAGG